MKQRQTKSFGQAHILSVIAVAAAAIVLGGCNVISLLGTDGVEVKWTFDTGAELTSGPAIGPDGTIYLGSTAGTLHALSAADGTEMWTFEASISGTTARFYGPAVATDGTVYAVVDSTLFAIDPQAGTQIWSFSSSEGPLAGEPAIGATGTVYVGTFDNSPDEVPLYAIDPTDGTVVWSILVQDVVGPVTIDSSGTVYYSSQNRIAAVDGATGTGIWADTGYNNRDGSPFSVGGDGTVYVGAYDTATSYGMFALNAADGDNVWSVPTDSAVYSGATIGSDGTIYFGATDNTVYAVDPATGDTKWTFDPMGAGTSFSTPAVGADGTVFVAAQNNVLYALEGTDGSRKWSYRTGGSLEASPIIGDDGTVYIASTDGTLYAFTTPSGAPANSPWPMIGQNASNTRRAP